LKSTPSPALSADHEAGLDHLGKNKDADGLFAQFAGAGLGVVKLLQGDDRFVAQLGGGGGQGEGSGRDEG
jgi:hypothetical protein